MRKPAFCICENKDAEQLHSNCAADQLVCVSSGRKHRRQVFSQRGSFDSLFNVTFQAYGQEVEAFVCFVWFLTYHSQ